MSLLDMVTKGIHMEQGKRNKRPRAAFLVVHHSPQTVLLVSYASFYPEEMLELSLWFKRQPADRI